MAFLLIGSILSHSTKKQNKTKEIYVFYHDLLLKKIEDLCVKGSVEIKINNYNLEKINSGLIKLLELPTVPCVFFSNVFDTGLEQNRLLQFEKGYLIYQQII